MTRIYPFALLITFLLLNGCVSKKKYLEEVARRGAAETVQAQQSDTIDSLNTRIDGYLNIIEEKNDEITALTEERNRLSQRNDELRAELNRIINESSSEQEKLDQALQAKAQELARKEAIIDELEASIRERDQYLRNILGSIENALRQYSADELTIEQRDGKIYVALSDKLLFASGSTKLEKTGEEALEKLASALKKNPEINVLVEGHTDSIPFRSGVLKDNWDLSVLRATSVVRILTEEYDLPPEQITAAGKGEYRPKATNETKEGRALNRRIEIIIEPKLNVMFNLLETTESLKRE